MKVKLNALPNKFGADVIIHGADVLHKVVEEGLYPMDELIFSDSWRDNPDFDTPELFKYLESMGLLPKKVEVQFLMPNRDAVVRYLRNVGYASKSNFSFRRGKK